MQHTRVQVVLQSTGAAKTGQCDVACRRYVDEALATALRVSGFARRRGRYDKLSGLSWRYCLMNAGQL